MGFDDLSPEDAWIMTVVASRVPSESVANRIHDPDKGAFSVSEEQAIRAALENGPLNKRQRLLCAIALLLGANAESIAEITEAHLKTDLAPYYYLELPLSKKRGRSHRGEEIGICIQIPERMAKEIEEQFLFNRTHLYIPVDYPYPIPLFPTRREVKQVRIDVGVSQESLFKKAGNSLTAELSSALKRCSLLSARTGKPLRVSFRRFRKTRITRMTEAGTSPEIIARLVGHDSTRSLRSYREIQGPGARAMQLKHLSPRTQAIADLFTGKLVASSAFPSRKISINNSPMGSCGTQAQCRLLPMLSCYGCPDFLAYSDVDHQQNLENLLSQYKSWAIAGVSKKSLEMLETSIRGCFQVIAESKVMKSIQAMRTNTADIPVNGELFDRTKFALQLGEAPRMMLIPRIEALLLELAKEVGLRGITPVDLPVEES